MINNGMFNDFVDKMELVYAVLLAWGFARVAEFFIWNITYTLAAIISGLVLIRFFFAASHNLKPVAAKSKGSSLKQIFLFLFDIPMLVLHSFIYYRMNFLLSQRDYFGFYRVFDWLLFINTLWLVVINLRIKTSGNKILPWCSKWAVNNFIFAVIIFFLLFSRDYYLLFCFSLLNCFLDFLWTAPCYLGFEDMPCD
jgi:hypothetical protein